MKLNWFSPLPPARTEIANYTARLLPFLAARAEITLWTNQESWDEALDTHAVIRRYKGLRVPWGEINRADLTIYHLGNHPLYHGDIWQLSRRHAGIIVLHDTRLQHFFAGLYRELLGAPANYLAEMRRHYGIAGERAAADFLSGDGGISIERLAMEFPLTPLAVENSLGVLVHTTQASLSFDGRICGPVAYAPLPFSPSDFRSLSAGDVLSDSETSALNATAPYRLIVFGHLSPNRRLASILETLGRLDEREAFRLDIYGQLWDAESVNEMIRAFKLGHIVRLHGFVSDDELSRALDAAHLAINLRYPTMGEASASQLRIWAHALPSVVSRTDWYAELPAEAVAHVRPEHEVADLTKHLRRFLADPPRFAMMGVCGRRFLEKEHTSEGYVDVIIKLAREAQIFRPQMAATYYAERVGEEIGSWKAGDQTRETYRRLAREIYALTAAK